MKMFERKSTKKTFRAATMLAMASTMLCAFQCFHYPDHEDESHHYQIHFKNCWDRPIRVISEKDDCWKPDPHAMYVPYEALSYTWERGEMIKAGKRNYFELLKEFYYEDWLHPGDSLFIAIFDDSERASKGDSLHFLASYLLSLDDLTRLHFRLTYPPMEEMRDVHMWPPYEDAARQAQSSEAAVDASQDME